MGAINDVFTHNVISFQKIEEILTILIENNENKSKNIKALQDVGLLKEYTYIKNNKSSYELTNFSKLKKTVKSYTNTAKLKENFEEWAKFFFNINNEDLKSVQKFQKKMENLKKDSLSKAFFRNNLKKYLLKNKSFHALINYGIPLNFREFIWFLAIEVKYAGHKCFNFEEEQKEYNSYLKTVQKNSQIEKDLNRTFINQIDQTNKNIHILRNVLNCINLYNKGYCQGMNFIVGFLLKLTNFDEVKTFYIFKNLLPEIKGYFEDDFPLLKKNISIFENYFKDINPNLYKHFNKNEIYNELWVGKWMQTLFTLSLPFEEVCQIWDILIIKGFDFIIYISLAIINSYEKQLLELNDSSDILAYLKDALNPENTSLIYKVQLEQEEKYFIPLNHILSKASQIKDGNSNTFVEKRPSDNNLTRFSNILKNENININNEYDSSSTKGSENSIRHTLSSKSSSCFSSSNDSNNQSFSNSSISINTNNNVNILKNNLCNSGFEQKNKSSIKKSSFFSSKNIAISNVNVNNNFVKNEIKRRSVNLNANYLGNSLINHNYPIITGQCIYYNNMNYNITDNRTQYTNFLTYYA